MDKAKEVDKVKVNKAENIDRAEEEAEEAEEVDSNNIVVELVASKATIDIIIITKLEFVIKTLLNTTEDID